MTKYLRSSLVVKEIKLAKSSMLQDCQAICMMISPLGCSSMCIVFLICPVLSLSKYSETWLVRMAGGPGADPGEVKWVNCHPPFFWTPFFFFSYPSNIEIIFDFSDFSDWGGECAWAMTGSTNQFIHFELTNTSTRLWFYYIITKIHPPFQNPGSVPGDMLRESML